MSEDAEVEQLKGRIGQTRADLGETVEALAAKADVKARASGAIHDAVDGAKTKVHDVVDGVVGGAKDKVSDVVGGAKDKVHGVVDGAKDKVGSAGTKARELVGGGGSDAGAEDDAALPALADEPDEPGHLSARERRLQGILLATAVGAMLGAVIVWVTRRR
jgi:hypothetical protein